MPGIGELERIRAKDGAFVSGGQAPVWLYEDSLPGTEQERGADRPLFALSNFWMLRRDLMTAQG